MKKNIGVNPFNTIYAMYDEDEDYETEVSAIELPNNRVILRTYTRDVDTVSETVTLVENVTIEDLTGKRTEQNTPS